MAYTTQLSVAICVCAVCVCAHAVHVTSLTCSDVGARASLTLLSW